MNKIKLPGILVSLLMMISCVGNSDNKDQQTLPEGWKLLSEYGYSIQYPADWDLNKSGQRETNFIILSQLTSDQDKYRDNVSLSIQDFNGMKLDLEQYTALSLRQIKRNVANCEIIESSRHRSNRKEFQKVEFTGDQRNIKLQTEQYYWIKKDKAYVLSFTFAANEISIYKETGERILNSFRFQ